MTQFRSFLVEVRWMSLKILITLFHWIAVVLAEKRIEVSAELGATLFVVLNF